MYTKHNKPKSELWKTVTLTSLQKPQLQPLSILILKFVHLFSFGCHVIDRAYVRLTRLFLCFIHFRGRSHSLNFDKFRDTAPLNSIRIKLISGYYG